MSKPRPLPDWVTARNPSRRVDSVVVQRQREAWNRRDRARAPLTRPVRMELIDAAGARCTYCGGQGTADPWWDSRGPDGRRWHFDHWVSLSRGGSTDLSNVVLACASCNSVKGSRNGGELVEWLLGEEQTEKHTPHRALMLGHLLGGDDA